MNELVKIEVKDGQQLVSGRELHERLELSERYSKWWDRMISYGFKEGKDYTPYQMVHPQNHQEIQDYLLTIPMAKELCMIQRNVKGKELRQYFIKCEEAWNSPEMILARANQIQSRMIEQHMEKIKILETKIEEDKPKVLFADAVATSQSSILIGDLAKLLKQNGIDTGQKRLFNHLRENGFLMKQKGESYNMPTQKSMELGLFEIKERTGVNPDGSIRISRTPKVTGKGQQYFINLFLKEKIA
ncbi:oxidoreductase [Fusobacterium necrophorum]|uniref:Oxidoreductase n=1 Tax=Fusobacterium necrophorum TaxID=859 RepID=A0A4Q2KW54_9FUSO|nr:phage antirepressor KilAC domain-containing protein [Fusobacterium necrophorum]RXZ69825.1 oxidoreductase [Fusobacterium necrophorum]